MEEAHKKANRHRILAMMSMDSQYWYTEDRLFKKINEDIFIPPAYYEQTDYYIKLQEVVSFPPSVDTFVVTLFLPVSLSL